MRALARVLAVAAFASVVVMTAAEAMAKSHDRDPAPARSANGRAPACLWPKRECHPPARLWYRVGLDLDATRSRPAAGRTVTDVRAENWMLEGNGAVRLTLECVDLRDVNPEPFLIERRINGWRRPIGGCGRNAREGRKPTVRFAALASGEVSRYEVDQTLAPWRIGAGLECSGRDWGIELTSTQGLTGQISTPSSLSDGLLVTLALANPAGNVHYDSQSEQCTLIATGETVTWEVPGLDLDFSEADLVGETATHWLAGEGDVFREWTELWRLIRFPLKPGDFGRGYRIEKTASQPERDPLPMPFPSFGTFWQDEQRYDYTVRLEPCPRKGLDVERC